MLGWFKMLMPREERFFDLFVRHGREVMAGAQALRDVLEGGDRIEQFCRQILEHETRADEITREVLVAVRRSFITPFDRTDIQDLISRMDDAIDQMNKTGKAILLFEVRSFEPQMQQMGGRQAFPHAAVRLRLALFAGAWRQRCAEDMGVVACCGSRGPRHRVHVRFWVVIVCQAAMGLGTLLGGWQIVHTMGSKITRLSPTGQRGDRRRAHAVRRHLSRHTGLDHAYHHRRHRRSRGGQESVGGALERGEQHRSSLGRHAAGDRPDRRAVLSCVRRDPLRPGLEIDTEVMGSAAGEAVGAGA